MNLYYLNKCLRFESSNKIIDFSYPFPYKGSALDNQYTIRSTLECLLVLIFYLKVFFQLLKLYFVEILASQKSRNSGEFSSS